MKKSHILDFIATFLDLGLYINADQQGIDLNNQRISLNLLLLTV